VQLVQNTKPEYIILSSGSYERFFTDIALKNHPDYVSKRRRFYAWVEKEALLVKEFPGKDIYKGGPIIKIYKISQL